MVHTKPMSELDGDFKDEEVSDRPCHKCNSTDVTVKEWTSSCGGYDDYKYTCKSCGHVWWVEGADS